MENFLTRWLIRVLVGLAPMAVAMAGEPAPSLGLPIDCQIGVSCWIFNYVDHEPGPVAKDYRCGTVTYDGHLGTDFAIRDMAALKAGVAVMAAAPGKVVGRRDGMDDRTMTESDRETLKGVECGNGVRLDHGDGWTTQYCHLRKDSVVVKPGDRVDAGQKLGLVGLSGLTQFPHVHFQVAKGTRIVDPFVGLARAESCGAGQEPLWTAETVAQLAYRPVELYNIGFSASEPKAEGVRQGLFHDKVLPRRAPMLLLWADIVALVPGDTVQFEIFDPDRKSLFAYSAAVTKKEARRFVYAGLPRKGVYWDEGVYRGVVRILRPDGAGRTESFEAASDVLIR